jgi:ElaB/YqjD/DUF883 family membrane-anchored ribosome-binding protein
MKRYNFSDSVRHDVSTVADHAKDLIHATARFTDHKIVEARRRLQAALKSGQDTFHYVENKVIVGARNVDEAVQRHPYRGIALALGVGIMLGFALKERLEDK